MTDPPYDREREPDYEWLDRFGRIVGGALLIGFLIVVTMVLIGCGSLFEAPPVPTTTTTTTTSTLVPPPPDYITVPRRVTTVPGPPAVPSAVPAGP